MNEPELEPRFCVFLTNVLLPCYSVSPWELSVNNFRIDCFFSLTFPLGFPHSIAETMCTHYRASFQLCSLQSGKGEKQLHPL